MHGFHVYYISLFSFFSIGMKTVFICYRISLHPGSTATVYIVYLIIIQSLWGLIVIWINYQCKSYILRIIKHQDRYSLNAVMLYRRLKICGQMGQGNKCHSRDLKSNLYMIEFIEVFSRLFLKIGPSRTIIMCNFQTLGKVCMESFLFLFCPIVVSYWLGRCKYKIYKLSYSKFCFYTYTVNSKFTIWQ